MELSEKREEDEQSPNDIMLQILECPVCSEYMSPPIFQCKTGHEICKHCKPKLRECPTCKQVNLDTRNYVAEKLTEQVKYPCVNEGCSAKVQLRSMAKHNAVCMYRLRDCVASSCDWRGHRADMLEHLKTMHEMAWMTATNPGLYYDDFDLATDFVEHDAIDAFENLFWFHFKRDVAKRQVFVAVQYVGDQRDAAKYRYQVFMASPDGSTWVDVVIRTHKDTFSFEELMNSKKCFSIEFEKVEDLLDADKCLKFKLNISKCDNSLKAAYQVALESV